MLGNRPQQSAPVSEKDADFLQVLIRKVAQNVGVDRIVAESRLVAFETNIPQPGSEIHSAPKLRRQRYDPPREANCPGQTFGRTW